MTLSEAGALMAVSAAGVALLVGLIWMLGFRGQTRIKDLQALALLHGLRLEESALDERGRAGVGITRDGQVFIARAMGLDIAVRVVARSAVKAVRVQGDRVRIVLEDFGFPGVALRMSTPPLWLGRIAR